MKAWVVSKYERPLELADRPEPEVGDRDVLVEIHAAGVNVLDEKIRTGEFKPILPYEPPFTLGHDLAGVVIGIGAGVRRFSVGDEVYARPRDQRIGTFAERLAVHEDDLAIKPRSLSSSDAASVPLVALTAWQALVEMAQVQPGQKVLVHAGSGGVGTYAIQLAKHLGATVATTAGAANHDWVRELGADQVVDYRREQFDDVLSGFDVVLDSQGERSVRRSLTVLKPGGLVIGIAGPPDPTFSRGAGLPLPVRLVTRGLSWKARRAARRLGVRYRFLFMRADGAQLQQIAQLIDDGTLRPVVERSYPFAEVPQALSHVASGHSKGKVVVEVVGADR
ncbi:Bifunctional protein: zinc-containing alcohol dehydrogenase quinone oxidoreductase (NADPH:quinone reductase) [Patulibacter medicamentivorans]|uniref:Bifunctional protein: zinc-containing alcohol dehydrogenase quinone oxidoreductase ( NADPH:quinone reductase) n=1 Tax=Patulibacter medicamentivorans TaxID=1097667 RepID=H0DZW1_9ACTN|nr:NADP-dependent oxidoreductase [Patulibacter medicamentivorans]EHN13065.1 Bifunctional protein: zinc-containing alcohol dehydrogenase quinone oxidoreductase (NADPH:quinone reductase) [Patulibacter medicamentivorans]